MDGAKPRWNRINLFKALTDLGRAETRRGKEMIFLRLLPGATARGDGSQINAGGPRLSFQKVKSRSKVAVGRL